MDIEKFKVLTLNCWGVFTPIVCEKRHERLSAISEKLSQGFYDIILLQEIWTESDFEKIKKKLENVYQYSNYFHSNLIGSGCCIFTKYRIVNTFFYRFSLNGYPHYLHHGDWFGGKGVGLATLETSLKKFTINVYMTHMHARYMHKEEDDQYSFHRISQGYDMGNFIRLTSGCCDAIIVGGDFNMDNSMIGFKLLTSNSGIKDAWIHANDPSKYAIEISATCDRPDGAYCNKKWHQYYPNGERLDYIFFKQNSCIKLECKSCTLDMRSVPGFNRMDYSDHCGVAAQFEISQNPLEIADGIDEEKRANACSMALEKLDFEINRIKKHLKMEIAVFILTLLCIVSDFPNILIKSVLCESGIPVIIDRFILFVLSILGFVSFWYFAVFRSNERKAILNVKQSLKIILNNSNTNIKNICGDEINEQ